MWHQAKGRPRSTRKPVGNGPHTPRPAVTNFIPIDNKTTPKKITQNTTMPFGGHFNLFGLLLSHGFAPKNLEL
jgi:hypothetical protein